jgi:DNA repair exonuclease SbcCD ATPase subunit
MAEVVIFDIDIKGAVDKLVQIRADINAYKEQQKQLTEEVKKGNQEAARSYEANQVVIKNLANEQRVLSRAVEGYSAVQKSATDTSNFYNNSIQQNRDLLKQLTAEYINLKKPTTEQTEQIRKLSDQLKEQESAIGNNVRNVGNYQGALKNAVSEINIFGVSLGTLETTFNGYNDALKDAKTQLAAYITGQKAADGATKLSIISTGGLSAAMNVLKLALISTGIGAFVVLLGSLIAALATTEKGVDLLEDAFANISGVVKSLFGEAQKLGVQLIDIFSNPKKAIKDLVDFLQGNLLNRLKSFGVILDGILEGDTKKITNGVAQLATGVENLTDKLENSAKAAGKFLTDAAKKGQEIINIQREIEDLEGAINKRRAEFESREKELLIIAKSVKSTAQERKKATDEILANTAKLQKLEEDIISKKIQELKLTQSQNITDREGNKELQDLEAQLIKVRDAGKDKQLQLIKLLNKESKEQLQNIKKTIPIVEQQIEGYDDFENKIKSIEKQSIDTQKELEKLLQTIYEPEEFFEEDQDVFDKVLSNIDKFKAGVIDSISEEDVIAQITGLDEKGVENVIGSVQVITGALEGLNGLVTQNIANRQNELQNALKAGEISEEEFYKKSEQLALREFNTQKSFNIVKATMDTITGAISAYANTPGGPVIKGVAAGVATAFGLAQVAAISRQEPPKFEEGGAIDIDGKSHSQGGENVFVGNRLVANVEGGEGLFVMKKNAYQAINKFSNINKAFGGNAWTTTGTHLANGGAINTNVGMSGSVAVVNENIRLQRALNNSLINLPAPELSIVEYEKKTAKRNRSIRISEI